MKKPSTTTIKTHPFPPTADGCNQARKPSSCPYISTSPLSNKPLNPLRSYPNPEFHLSNASLYPNA
ncbi:hypothetical protein BO94DRAFT_535617 [Aspergillus sclerotioniger CBS 115572]|uniref:Uncharacterized protein n=1 Tax=Aspergillus sclerotioniger CBS 115572 TaxID=1450535 RepID=A0A317WN05_9EURO|nr:hypothetical protein BO94DRAFT_535617 [Aspergillus sclerotioniger CBS 115572]PWY86457.1 hypothetical protein BO94DRAFT_535617 [Aspergillus sclerotioniger CBS 115572]